MKTEDLIEFNGMRHPAYPDGKVMIMERPRTVNLPVHAGRQPTHIIVKEISGAPMDHRCVIVDDGDLPSEVVVQLTDVPYNLAFTVGRDELVEIGGDDAER